MPSYLSWHTRPDRWSSPRIYHGPFQDEYASRIKLIRHPREGIQGEWRKSPNRAYAYLEREPDRTKRGPWTMAYFIDNERDHLVRLILSDYKWVKTHWINEKLLYVQVWWGRILGTYLIIDVEAEKVVFREMVHDGRIAYDQWQQGEKKEGPR